MPNDDHRHVPKAPDRIFATVNGATSTFPAGTRQLIGGWSERDGGARHIAYIRSDIHAAQLADLQALHTALGASLVAMTLAAALPVVEAEYDFSEAIQIAREAYARRKK